MKCKICGYECKNFRSLGIHISRSHKNEITLKEYYDRYLKKDGEGICPVCGSECHFISLGNGYHTYCCVKCQSNATKEKCKQTKFKHFGEGKYFSDAGIKSISAANSANKETRLKKALQTIKEKTGKDVTNISQLDEVKQKVANTNIEKCGNKCSLHGTNQDKTEAIFIEKYGCKNPVQNPDVLAKIKATNLKRRNCETPWADPVTIQKRQNNYYEKTGYHFPSQNPAVFSTRRTRYEYEGHHFDSKPELAFYIWNKDHQHKIEAHPNIPLKYEYKGQEHIYQPDFLVDGKLVEIKGLQFFDDDKMINPFNRSMDGLFEAKHQCMIKNSVQIITDYEMYVSYVNDTYTKDFMDLFARNIAFPYLNADLKNKGDLDIIRHFHKSIYEASYSNKPSPLAAWNNKEIILKVAKNRLKYVNRCRPSDIVQGFNVMKVAPKVSVFRPSLAERLIKTYLSDYETVFDPFSGFSGRLIGAANAHKKYIGQDIHKGHVEESNALIAYKGYKKCKVIQKDIFEDEGGDYDCLFTCPPYGGKEHWNKNNDEVEKTCDEWIDVCLSKYKCKQYLFVVDDTAKYKDKIIETLENKSHFGSNYEYVVMI